METLLSNLTEIKSVKEYYQQLKANKLDNIDEMD